MADLSLPAPQLNATQLLEVKGDPALGGGFNSSGLPTGVGAEATAPINDMLNQVMQNQFAQNAMIYKQRIADRNASLDALADPSLNVPADVLDKDRPELNQKLQAIRDAWQANPNMMANPDAFVNFKKLTSDFTQAANSSKARDLEYKKQMGIIATEPNDATRADMLKHLDGQLDQGVDHQVDPYFQNNTFDANKYFVDVPYTDSGSPAYSEGENGVPYVTKIQRMDPAAFSKPFTSQALLANNGQGLQDMQNLYGSFFQTKAGQDPSNIAAINTNLANFNQENGLKQGDANFANPIATVSGDTITPAQSPGDVAKALYIWGSWHPQKSTTDISKDYEDVKKGNASIASSKASAASSYASANEQNTDAYIKKQKLPYEIAKLDAESKADLNKVDADEKSASAPATTALVAFHNANAATYKPLNQFATTGTPSEQLANAATMTSLKQQSGISDNDQIAALPNDYGNVKILSVPKYDDKSGKLLGITKPSSVYAIKSADGDPNKTKLVGVDATGKIMKMVDIRQAPGEAIKYDLNYKNGAKVVPLENAAGKIIENTIGGGDKTVSETPVVVKPSDNTSSAKPGAPLRREPGTNKKQVSINGQWKDIVGGSSANGYIYNE
jgi:hypothetical protein